MAVKEKEEFLFFPLEATKPKPKQFKCEPQKTNPRFFKNPDTSKADCSDTYLNSGKTLTEIDEAMEWCLMESFYKLDAPDHTIQKPECLCKPYNNCSWSMKVVEKM